ncbi:MAG: hypothetical protein R6W84_16270 [Promethearchaeia archaeon]
MKDEISLKDIAALKSVLILTNKFFKKILIKKRKFNLKRIENQLKELESNLDQKTNDQLKKYKKLLKKIKNGIQNEISSQIFFILAHHGGIIIDDMGFCEFDIPKYAFDKLIEKMELALENNMPLNLEIAVSCLEKLNNDYPKKFSKFKEIFYKGRFQIINPSYSLPYNLIIGSESNIKQIEFGLNILNKIGLECNFFYASESSVHPQLPQILKNFEMKSASLRSRLLGMNPTSVSGNIDWIGLDNTKIQTITNQAGIFTGEYFHGTFFQEIPNLLFQSLSFPFNDYILYSNIEDFVLSLPYQEEVWNVSNYCEIFGNFILCSDFIELTEKRGSFKFIRDSFYLGDKIFVENRLFYHNKICETLLISIESLNSMFNLGHSIDIENDIQQMWKDLLITQTHDSYAVPFLHSGDYFIKQLEKEEREKLKINRGKVSISNFCLQIQKKIEKKGEELINTILKSYLKELKIKDHQNPSHIFIVNPSPFLKRELVSIPWNFKINNDFKITNQKNEFIPYSLGNSDIEFIAEVPAFGYKIYDITFSKSIPLKHQDYDFDYSVKISNSKKTIEVRFKNKYSYKIEFNSKYPYTLEIIDYNETDFKEKYVIKGLFKNGEFFIEISQYKGINKLEFNLNAKLINEIIIKPNFKILETYINYPFGIEQTKRNNIQTLDFLLVKNNKLSLLYIQKSSQKFKIDHNKSEIHNEITGKGTYEFAILLNYKIDITEAYFQSKSYFYNLYGTFLSEFNEPMEKLKSFLSVSSSIMIENIWKREDNQFIRLFNPSEKLKKVKLDGLLISKHIEEINLKYRELGIIDPQDFDMKPWEIKTIKIKTQKRDKLG